MNSKSIFFFQLHYDQLRNQRAEPLNEISLISSFVKSLDKLLNKTHTKVYYHRP